jgi:hypothetical protein
MKMLVFACVIAALLMPGCAARLSEQEASAILRDYMAQTFSPAPGGSDLAVVIQTDLRRAYAAAILGDRNPPTGQVALAVLLPDAARELRWSVAKTAVFNIDSGGTLNDAYVNVTLLWPAGAPKLSASDDSATRQWWETYMAAHRLTYSDETRHKVGEFFKTGS